MSKRLHPIRKMHAAMLKKYVGKEQLVVAARHVKPLLDALERTGHGVRALRCVSYSGGVEYGHDDCADCRLLAAWKEPLR